MKFDSPVGWFKRAHEAPDTDQKKTSLHHTLGYGPNQAASGAALKDLADKVAALEEGGGGSSFIGLTDYEEGMEYPKGAMVIYGGSVYAARVDTTESPIVSQPIAGDFSDSASWSHNSSGSITDDVVNVLEGPIASTPTPVGPSVVEKSTHNNLIGSTLTVEAKITETSTAASAYGLALGIINADRPVTQVNLISNSASFYGWYIVPQGFRYYANTAGGTVGAAGAGLGVFDWSTLSVKYEPVDANNLTMILLRNNVELRRQTVANPTFNNYRIALGGFITANVAVPTSFISSVRDIPILGAQSVRWRRIVTVADIN